MGNYYSEYNGYDLDGNGIGDIPLNIGNSEAMDNYPMMFDLPKPPKANFTSNVTAGYAPLWVQFTDISAWKPTQWHWEFGDGATSEQQNPVHAYTTPGTYLVNLTTTNEHGSNTVKMADLGTVMSIRAGSPPVHNLRSGLNYETISEAIAAAQAGDTIRRRQRHLRGERGHR